MPPESPLASAAPARSSAGVAVLSDADLQGLRDGVLALLRSLCRRSRVDAALADDLCNETFRVLLERLQNEPLREPDKIAAFLAQTARHLFTAERRKHARHRTVTGEEDLIGDHPDPAPDAPESLRSLDLARIVYRVLDRMTVRRDREILVRHYLRDEDKAVICRDLGLTEMHYNRVIDRARARFKALLDDNISPGNLFSLVLA